MKKFKVGIQLWSVRDAVEADMEATLKALKEMGYDYVEFAGYFGKSADEVKAILDKCGLEAKSVHQAPELFETEGKAAVDFLNTIGAKYCAIPFYSPKEFIENWDATIERFENVSKILRDGGVTLMYHNHGTEFQKIGDEYILDKLYRTLSSDVLMPQIDTFWVHYSGVNPAEYIKKYSGKIDTIHLKDYVPEGNEAKLVPVGHGIQNFPSILKTAEEAGVEYVIVEQDSSADRDPMEAAKMSRDYLKSIGL